MPPPGKAAIKTNLTEILVEKSLIKFGLEREEESAAEGKKIEKIWIDRYDVFLEEESLVSWLNVLHFLTKERTIREELLFQEGEAWQEKLGRETARNLRTFLPVTVAQVVTCKGTQPDSTQVLVVTRDVWSLRTSYELRLTDGRLEYFWLGLLEYNLWGHAEVVSPFILEMDQRVMSFSQRYRNPRLGWSRIGLSEEGGPIYNYTTGTFEGGRGQIRLGSGFQPEVRTPGTDTAGLANQSRIYPPLYSLSAPWGWEVDVTGISQIRRTFASGTIARVPATSTGESLPLQLSESLLKVDAAVIRSYGYEYKNNFALGWRLRAPVYRFEPVSGETYQPESIYEFNREYLPVEDRYGMLFLQYNFLEARFAQLMNMESMGLVEDFRLGPQVYAELGVATPAFLMDSTFIAPRLGVRYNEVWGGDGLSTLEAEASVRRQFTPNYLGYGDWVSGMVSVLARQAFPMMWDFARVVVGARVNLRIDDLNKTISTVGGENFLRGYPSGAFQGFSTWGANLEIRSKPWRFTQYFLLGGATYFDMGDAFNKVGDVLSRRVHKAVGLGVRAMIPQVNKYVLRFDVGFPLDGAFGPSTTLQFQQAF